MPYRRLQFVAGHLYHIYNRGAARMDIFREPENLLFVVRLMKRYASELHLKFVAYCLMPNHYHFLVRQAGDQAAGLLPQAVFNCYSKAFNKRYGRSGTLFEDRFRAVHVDQDAYVSHLCAYIHGNPVKAGLVLEPEAWPYSNYPEWIGLRGGALVDLALVRTVVDLVGDYRTFVTEYLSGIRLLAPAVTPYMLDA